MFHSDREMHLTKDKQLIVFNHVSEGFWEAIRYLRMSAYFFNITVYFFVYCMCVYLHYLYLYKYFLPSAPPADAIFMYFVLNVSTQFSKVSLSSSVEGLLFLCTQQFTVFQFLGGSMTMLLLKDVEVKVIPKNKCSKCNFAFFLLISNDT